MALTYIGQGLISTFISIFFGTVADNTVCNGVYHTFMLYVG